MYILMACPWLQQAGMTTSVADCGRGKSFCKYSRAAAEALLAVAPKAAVDIRWASSLTKAPRSVHHI